MDEGPRWRPGSLPHTRFLGSHGRTDGTRASSDLSPPLPVRGRPVRTHEAWCGERTVTYSMRFRRRVKRVDTVPVVTVKDVPRTLKYRYRLGTLSNLFRTDGTRDLLVADFLVDPFTTKVTVGEGREGRREE